MFRKNKHHLQPLLISTVNELPEKQRQRLQDSWAGVFYREFFCRLKEEPFAVLYATKPSRPNVPVNILVGLETLKAGFGWSDEELHDAFTYNLQVRFALGFHALGEGDFELRTLYNFRQRLSHYNQTHGLNLLAEALADITDQQLVALQLRTGQQRMDSTQIASNILGANRLHLLVEALQRLWRQLSEADQARYQAEFSPYIQHSSGQYVYRVKGPAATSEQLALIGQVLHHLLETLAGDYAADPVYQVCQRFWADNFTRSADTVQPKANADISAKSLQSLDDLEATYRQKGNQSYQGYVINLSETCDPANPVQLITHVQVAPNTTEDAALLVKAVPALKARMALDTLHTDGAYPSPAGDNVLQAAQVVQIQTAMRGRAPDPEHFALADFTFQMDSGAVPQQITCPAGQIGTIRWRGPARSELLAEFQSAPCLACPFHQTGRCRAKPGKRDPRFRLEFSLVEVRTARRRQACQAQKSAPVNLRVAIEATMRVIKHPFPAGKLPVRGLFRVTSMLIGSAAMVNIRSVYRYLSRKRHADPHPRTSQVPATRTAPSQIDGAVVSGSLSFLSFWAARFQHLLRLATPPAAARCA